MYMQLYVQRDEIRRKVRRNSSEGGTPSPEDEHREDPRAEHPGDRLLDKIEHIDRKIKALQAERAGLTRGYRRRTEAEQARARQLQVASSEPPFPGASRGS